MTPRSPAARVAVVAGLLIMSGVGLLSACAPSVQAPPVSATATRTDVPNAGTDPGVTAGPTSETPPHPAPPFVAAATWVRGSGGRSLHVVPTAAGRVAHGAGDAGEAWGEVLRLAPDADQLGMQSQFDCHWTYARLAQPDKPSWNLEPWRPVVSEQQLVDDRCNPGGPDSAEG